MNLYRQSIILFGMVVPILLGLAVVGIGYKVKSSIHDKFEAKLVTFRQHKLAKAATHDIEIEIERQREHLDRWIEMTSLETVSSVSTNLKEITEKLPAKEIQQTAFDRQNNAGEIGKASQQKSTQIRIAFRGTYRTLQRALLELETRMPQLQLDEIKMAPMSSNAALLNIQVAYTAWEN